MQIEQSASPQLESGYGYLILALALLSFLFTLPLPYIGEEGVYTLSAYEMWFQRQFLYPILHGVNYGRPPFYNWLIIPLASLLGWPHMLLAARLVTALATIGTGLMVAYLARHLFDERGFSLFALLIYLTGDALMYHGWLAYSDPLFAFLIFAALALLWIANLERRYLLVCLAALAISAAFLTKALTAYVFYLLAFALFTKQTGRGAFLLKPANLWLQLLAVSFPLGWSLLTSWANGAGMVQDILNKFSLPEPTHYLKQIIAFPLEMLVRFLPATGLAAYFLLRRRLRAPENHPQTVLTLSLLILFNFIPYWLVPNTSSRYLLPLYPLFALWLARLLWRSGAAEIKLCLKWLAAAVAIKYMLALGFFPYYQKYHRGDYSSVAWQILEQIKDRPLYANASSATGLSVTAALDILRYPAPPLVLPQLAKEPDYFVVSNAPEPSIGKVYAVFPLGRQKSRIYLLCKGRACAS